MAKKEFTYRGKKLDELKMLSINEFAELIPSRQRRALKGGLSEEHKKILDKIRKDDKNLKTRCRDMVIIPEMVGHSVKVYTGKDYFLLAITEEMIGHYLGEFALTRRRVMHNAPGIGATKSSAAISVR
jgi:small subunit ribosomal protein S19